MIGTSIAQGVLRDLTEADENSILCMNSALICCKKGRGLPNGFPDRDLFLQEWQQAQ